MLPGGIGGMRGGGISHSMPVRAAPGIACFSSLIVSVSC
jgi:hypothetical protein